MTQTIALSGEQLTAEDVWAVAFEDATASLAPDAVERMRAAREVVNARRTARASTRMASTRASESSFPRRFRQSSPRAPASSAPQPCVRRRRALSRGDRPRCHAAAREHARQGVLGRACRARLAACRMPEPRLATACAEPRIGRRERRSRAARPPRAAACRRGGGFGRGRAAAGRRGARNAGARADRLRGEGRPLARQRHAVHGCVRCARARARTAPREGG